MLRKCLKFAKKLRTYLKNCLEINNMEFF